MSADRRLVGRSTLGNLQELADSPPCGSSSTGRTGIPSAPEPSAIPAAALFIILPVAAEALFLLMLWIMAAFPAARMVALLAAWMTALAVVGPTSPAVAATIVVMLVLAASGLLAPVLGPCV